MDEPTKWIQFLPWVEYSYNTTIHTSLGIFPFQVVYDRLPPTIILYENQTSDLKEVDKILSERDKVLQHPIENLMRTQNQMKLIADKRMRDV